MTLSTQKEILNYNSSNTYIMLINVFVYTILADTVCTSSEMASECSNGSCAKINNTLKCECTDGSANVKDQASAIWSCQGM